MHGRSLCSIHGRRSLYEARATGAVWNIWIYHFKLSSNYGRFWWLREQWLNLSFSAYVDWLCWFILLCSISNCERKPQPKASPNSRVLSTKLPVPLPLITLPPLVPLAVPSHLNETHLIPQYWTEIHLSSPASQAIRPMTAAWDWYRSTKSWRCFKSTLKASLVAWSWQIHKSCKLNDSSSSCSYQT